MMMLTSFSMASARTDIPRAAALPRSPSSWRLTPKRTEKRIRGSIWFLERRSLKSLTVIALTIWSAVLRGWRFSGGVRATAVPAAGG